MNHKVEYGNTAQPKWVCFERVPFNGKTSIWNVALKEGILRLGSVRWWPAWRKYAFFPEPDTLYEQDCLWDIADFCARKTQEHRASWKHSA